jgi:hypothetical protein
MDESASPNVEAPPPDPSVPDPVATPPTGAGPPERARFGIRHLLLWTALSAVLLANQEQAIRHLAAGAQLVQTGFYTAHRALSCVLEGAALLSFFVAANCWRQRIRFPVYPGEWLWLFEGCMTLFSVFRIQFELRYIDRDWGLLPSGLLGVGLSILPLVVLVIARLPQRWRFLMAVLAAETFWDALRSLLFSYQRMIGGGFINLFATWINMLTASVLILSAAAVAAIDARRAGHLPWTHWLPLAIVAGIPLLGLLAGLVALLAA